MLWSWADLVGVTVGVLAHRCRTDENPATDGQRRPIHHAAAVQARKSGVPKATGAARLVPDEHPARWARQLHKSQIILQHNVLLVCWFTLRYSWVHGRMRIIYVTAAWHGHCRAPQGSQGAWRWKVAASRPSRPPTYWLRLKEGGSSNDN